MTLLSYVWPRSDPKGYVRRYTALGETGRQIARDYSRSIGGGNTDHVISHAERELDRLNG